MSVRRAWSLLLALLMVILAGQAMAEADWAEAFPDKFLAEGEAPVVTETSYRSANVAIEITSQRYGGCDVYMADIYLRSMDSFQRYFAQGVWGKSKDTVPAMAAASGAILALTGDSSQNFRSGWVMGNGGVGRDGSQKINTVRDICIIGKNGEMRPVLSPSKEQNVQLSAETDDIWHIFLFGPSLLDEEGKAYAKASFDKRVTPPEVVNMNPRSVLGYYEPGHYCFVQVDGRETKSALEAGARNRGLTMYELAQLMESLGCTAAYNLDGGRSSMLWFNGGLISTPAAANRQIGDILVIMDGE